MCTERVAIGQALARNGLLTTACIVLIIIFSAASLTAGDVTLAWSSNTEPTLAGYKIYCGQTSYSYGNVIDVGLVTTYRLTGLPDGTYYFAVTAYDNTGFESGFSNEVSTKLTTLPPTISSATASSLAPWSATISWITDTPADSQVEYGTSANYGSSTTLDTSLLTSHSVALISLTPGTVYHYRVKSSDAAMNQTVSDDSTFTTLPPLDTTPPVISAISSLVVSSAGATITWTTDEPADSQVEYGISTAYGSSTTLDTGLLTSHSVALISLTPGTVYHYRVKSSDAAMNQAVSDDSTFTTLPPPDTTPPVISAITSSGVSSTGATITWTTDEPADEQVEYGISTAYGSSTTLDTSLLTSHSVALSSLTPGTMYHYRVKSRDAAGNLASSRDFVFMTGSAFLTGLISHNVDFNGDGYADALLYNASTGAWSLMLGNGGNGFVTALTGSWPPGLDIYTADFDGNGLTDLFLYDGVTGRWFKMTNDGSAHFTISGEGDFAAGARVYIIDLDGDGHDDVFAYCATTGAWFECISNAVDAFDCYNGTWPPGLVLSIEDLNGDGRPDILAYDPITGAWYQYIASSPGTFVSTTGFWDPGMTVIRSQKNADGR